jgi:GT2 family glycosyltransferase
LIKKITNMTETVGLVVIGRNEGQRLMLSLQSMQDSQCPLVYVDSGSTDQSVANAKSLADVVHQLDPARPFSAARARNEGFEALIKGFPSVQYVQFVDGDCILAPEWINAAKVAFQADTARAVIVGHLEESYPEASVYNKLCALEWKSAVGDMKNFGALGGISMVRKDVFIALQGFRENVIAGEDSEFGVRLSLAGYKVTKIDQHMATHDANMTRFGQWWKRAVRAGHAIGQRADLNGSSAAKDCIQERKSTLFWGVFLPCLALLLLIPSKGLSLIILLAYFLLAFKVFRYRQQLGEKAADAWIYAKFIVLGKIANGIGLVKYYFNRINKKYEIIEYK